MGQYHYLVNLDKKEAVTPQMLGDGLKLHEQHGYGGLASALHMLLACSSGRGGGDYNPAGTEAGWVGRWAGDRIAIVGDYAEPDDLPDLPGCEAEGIFSAVSRAKDGEPSDWTDITPELIPWMEQEFELIYFGSSWAKLSLHRAISGFKYSHSRIPDMERVIAVEENGRVVDVEVREVRKALRDYFEEHGRYTDKLPVTLKELGLTGTAR